MRTTGRGEFSNQASLLLEKLAGGVLKAPLLVSFSSRSRERVTNNQTIKHTHCRPATMLQNPITPITLFQRLLPPQPSQSGPTHPSIHVSSYSSLHVDYLPNMYALEYRKPESKERKKRSNSTDPPTRRRPAQPSPALLQVRPIPSRPTSSQLILSTSNDNTGTDGERRREEDGDEKCCGSTITTTPSPSRHLLISIQHQQQHVVCKPYYPYPFFLPYIVSLQVSLNDQHDDGDVACLGLPLPACLPACLPAYDSSNPFNLRRCSHLLRSISSEFGLTTTNDKDTQSHVQSTNPQHKRRKDLKNAEVGE
ncbi:hypothetical protein HDK64DRAFT_17308 [Phyllosticta capitalensis]